MATRYISSWYNHSPNFGQGAAPYSPFANCPSLTTFASYNAGHTGHVGQSGCTNCNASQPSQFTYAAVQPPVDTGCKSASCQAAAIAQEPTKKPTRLFSSWFNKPSPPSQAPPTQAPIVPTQVPSSQPALPAVDTSCGGCSSCKPPPPMINSYSFVEMTPPVEAVCKTCAPAAPAAPAAPRPLVPAAAAASAAVTPRGVTRTAAGPDGACDVCINGNEARISKNLKVSLQMISLVLTFLSAVGVGLGIGDVIISKINFFANSGAWNPCTSKNDFASALKPTNGIATTVFWAIVPTPIWASLYVFFVGFFARDACRFSKKGLDTLLNVSALALGFFIPLQLCFAIINLIMTMTCANGGSAPEQAKIAAPSVILIISVVQLILLSIVTSIVAKQRKCVKVAKKNASTVYNANTASYGCNCAECLAAAAAAAAAGGSNHVQNPMNPPMAQYAPPY